MEATTDERTFIATAEILETEANQLAHLVDDKAFKAMNYRVEIAVLTEMQRLRDLASRLGDKVRIGVE